MVPKRLYLLLWVALLTVSGCQKKELSHSVASWRSVELSEPVFKTQYVRYLSTAPIEDSMENRKAFAQRLLERKIVAQIASEAKFDTLKPVREALLRKRETSLARHFVRSRIEPAIQSPNEDEVWEAYRRSNTRVKLWQIYAPSKQEINDYYSRLKQDSSSFKELAMESMLDAGESAEAFKMGWVNWNEMDLAPERTAFDLEIHENSKPVQSLAGWHIFRMVNKEETFFADKTTFNNAKEKIQTVLKRRRFEEESVKFIDSVLSRTELAVYPENINRLWNYLAPRLPSNNNQIPAVLNKEANSYHGDSLSPNLTLAVLDGTPFTVADFMMRLPNIPYWQLQPNLRPALETLLKDKFFSDRAIKEGIQKEEEIQKEIEIERVRVLNLAYKNALADTLNLNRIAGTWYDKWKDRYIKNKVVEFNTYSFEDSTTARIFLKELLKSKDQENTLSNFKQHWQKNRVSLNSIKHASHPVFELANAKVTENSITLWGPYLLNGTWEFLEVLSERKVYREFEEVQQDLLQDIVARIPEVTHQEILAKADYNPDEIEYNESILQEVLPFYF